jgi:phospholipid/cholesterol/gamma-HCH transport system permease protein
MGFLSQVLTESALFPKKKQVAFRVLIMQIYFTGVEALGVITIISLSMGAVIIIQGHSLFAQFGQSDLLYSVLIIVITRELGPILTAFIIIARSGTAIATELGGMVVSHQVEAYIAIGVNPISYLVVPRFLGMVIAMIVLNIYFNFIGLFGAFFVSQLFNAIPFEEYFKNLLGALQTTDILSSMTKSLLFGTIISTVATYQGFNVKVSSTEVPQVVIKAFGQGIVLCLIADVIMMLILRL